MRSERTTRRATSARRWIAFWMCASCAVACSRMAGGETGIEECDTFLTQYRCFLKKSGMSDSEIDKTVSGMTKAWRDAAGNPAARSAVVEACRSQLGAQASSFSNAGCGGGATPNTGAGNAPAQPTGATTRPAGPCAKCSTQEDFDAATKRGQSCCATKACSGDGDCTGGRVCCKIPAGQLCADAGRCSAKDRVKGPVMGFSPCRSTADCGGNSCCVSAGRTFCAPACGENNLVACTDSKQCARGMRCDMSSPADSGAGVCLPGAADAPPPAAKQPQCPAGQKAVRNGVGGSDCMTPCNPSKVLCGKGPARCSPFGPDQVPVCQ